MSLSSSFVLSSSSVQLSPAFSVLLVKIIHCFNTPNTHHELLSSEKFCIWLGKCILASKLLSRRRGCNNTVLLCTLPQFYSIHRYLVVSVFHVHFCLLLMPLFLQLGYSPVHTRRGVASSVGGRGWTKVST